MRYLLRLCIILLICLSSCKHRLSVDNKGIYSTYSLTTGHIIDKISVDSLYSSPLKSGYWTDSLGYNHSFDNTPVGCPMYFTKIATVDQLLTNCDNNIKNVYFHKEKTCWQWLKLSDSTVIRSKRLPFEFKPGDWYRVWNRDLIGYYLFFNVKEDGSFDTYYLILPMNFF